jgi:CDP-diacylglycerol--serine O-phosphatidyltransferase
MPIPAAGLLIAAFPLVYWYNNQAWAISLLSNKWFWYAVIFIVSYLMISTLPMLALKFKNATIKSFLPFIIMAIIAIISAFIIKWMAVPITFAAYVIISLVFKQSKS